MSVSTSFKFSRLFSIPLKLMAKPAELANKKIIGNNTGA